MNIYTTNDVNFEKMFCINNAFFCKAAYSKYDAHSKFIKHGLMLSTNGTMYKKSHIFTLQNVSYHKHSLC